MNELVSLNISNSSQMVYMNMTIDADDVDHLRKTPVV